MREHWIVARIDLDVPGSKQLGGSPLESLRRITSQTPHDEGAPVESPKMFEAHCTVARGPWERRAASQCPFSSLQILKVDFSEKGGSRRNRNTWGFPVLSWLPDRLANSFSVEKGESVNEDQATNAFPRQLCDSADHHAAGAGCNQHDIVEVLKEEELGDLFALRFNRDAGTNLIMTLGTTIKGWRVDRVAFASQQLSRLFPHPASLASTVDQYVRRQFITSLLVVGTDGPHERGLYLNADPALASSGLKSVERTPLSRILEDDDHGHPDAYLAGLASNHIGKNPSAFFKLDIRHHVRQRSSVTFVGDTMCHRKGVDGPLA
jgi:hypothetical protein